MTAPIPRADTIESPGNINKWPILAALAIISSLLIGGTLVSLSVYIPVLEHNERWAAESLGAAATGLLLGMSLAGIASGIIIDRLSARYVIIGGTLVASLGCWLAGESTTAGMFIVATTMIGAGLGFATNVPSIPIISNLFGPNRGLGLGIYFSMLALSAGVLPPIASALIGHLGWRSAMYVTGATIAFSCMLAVLVRLPTIAEQRTGHSPDEVEIQVGVQVGSAISTVSFWALASAMTLSLISVQGVLFSVVAYFINSGMSNFSAVNIYSVANMAGVPGLFAIGALADRIGARRVLPYGLIVQSVGTLALLFAIFHGPAGWIAVGIFSVFWGVSSGLPSQVGPMLLEDAFGSRHFGALLGINTAITGIMSAFAPVFAAWIREISGSYATIFITFSLMTLAAVPVIWLVRPRFLAEPGSLASPEGA